MNSDKYIKSILDAFIKLLIAVEANNAANPFDINSTSENVYVPILKKIFNCPDLKNLDLEKENYPAVDLGCDTSKICFQIMSSKDSKKMIKTLKKI